MVVRILVLGFLAAAFWAWLAFPVCGCSTRAGAYYAASKSDLKDLASQQEIYYSEHLTYSTDPQELAFTNSDGVIVDIRLHDASKAWSASASHVATRRSEDPASGESCVIYYGYPGEVPDDAVPRTNIRDEAPSQPGEIACDYKRPISVKRAVMDFLLGWM